MKKDLIHTGYGMFDKVRPNPRQSVALHQHPAGLLASPLGRRPSRCFPATVAVTMPVKFPVFVEDWVVLQRRDRSRFSRDSLLSYSSILLITTGHQNLFAL